jgi:potassium channel subfamily K
MPQSLVHEFLDQKAAGNPLGRSLKEAIFQAKPPLDIEEGQIDDVPKFQLWKVRMRAVNDEEPLYVVFQQSCCFKLSCSVDKHPLRV